MGHVLVIDWRDVDANSNIGGTKLEVREGGAHGTLLNDNGKVNFADNELDQALQMAKRLLDEAKTKFDNAKAKPPSV